MTKIEELTKRVAELEAEVARLKAAPAQQFHYLAGYLAQVSEYWEKDGSHCGRCQMYDGPGYCAMLHDGVVPEGDCAGLLARDGVHQP